jgi:hypothetical protein
MSHLGSVMLQNAEFVRKKLPNVVLPDDLRANVAALCDLWVKRYSDLGGDPSPDLWERWVSEALNHGSSVLSALGAAVQTDHRVGSAYVLVAESILNVCDAVCEIRPLPRGDVANDTKLRCRVGDLAVIVRGPWAGRIVEVVAPYNVPPFNWNVKSCSSPFTFEGRDTDKVWAHSVDSSLRPLNGSLEAGVRVESEGYRDEDRRPVGRDLELVASTPAGSPTPSSADLAARAREVFRAQSKRWAEAMPRGLNSLAPDPTHTPVPAPSSPDALPPLAKDPVLVHRARVAGAMVAKLNRAAAKLIRRFW